MADSAPPQADVDMTPMIDVVFLLIIFFMVVADMTAADFAELTLPFADQAQDPAKAEFDENPTLVVNVVQDGTIKISGTDYSNKQDGSNRMTVTDFLKIEAEAAAREPAPEDNPSLRPSKLRVIIRGDARTRFKNIQAVFDACQKNGIYKTVLGASRESANKSG